MRSDPGFERNKFVELKWIPLFTHGRGKLLDYMSFRCTHNIAS